jgi:menaquinone-specific isochorismate synthase
MKTDRFLEEELQKINSILQKKPIENKDVSFYFSYQDLNIYDLLNYVTCEKIFYFKSKYSDFNVLALGHARTVKARDLQHFLEKHPEHFLVASFLFEQDPWLTEFHLPEWIFVTKEGKTNLTLNKCLDTHSFALPSHFFASNTKNFLDDSSFSHWQSYYENPERDQWSQLISHCEELFDRRELQKIVLSRQKIFNFNQAVNPLSFFKKVMEKNNFANSSYAIFHQTSLNHSFISLTPEKLFSLKGNIFETISLAASAPRGVSLLEDKKHEELLNTSDKLTREHNLVTEDIIQRIMPYCESVNVSPLQTMKLPYIQHRSVPILAKLLPNIGPLEIVALLHPTPAVGGLPKEQALIIIKELECYDRLKYAAPIGVLSSLYSELAVGIRCALIEEEWLETHIKMNPFLKVVTDE